jgi:hypothetical protein
MGGDKVSRSYLVGGTLGFLYLGLLQSPWWWNTFASCSGVIMQQSFMTRFILRLAGTFMASAGLTGRGLSMNSSPVDRRL